MVSIANVSPQMIVITMYFKYNKTIHSTCSYNPSFDVIYNYISLDHSDTSSLPCIQCIQTPSFSFVVEIHFLQERKLSLGVTIISANSAVQRRYTMIQEYANLIVSSTENCGQESQVKVVFFFLNQKNFIPRCQTEFKPLCIHLWDNWFSFDF